MFTTVRIETKDTIGKEWVATGFLFNYKKQENQYYTFLVTNKHVVKNKIEGTITFMKGKDKKPLLGRAIKVNIPDFANMWHVHPNLDIDVAVGSFTPILESMQKNMLIPYYRTVPSDLIPSEETWKEIDAIEEIIFIGYPSGIWDSKYFLPLTRMGITATHPTIDYEGKPQFLIDASVFPGSSGSPVFLYDPRTRPGKVGIIPPRLFFLGILASFIHYNEENEVKTKTATKRKSVAYFTQIVDLGIVYKAKTILETIEDLLSKK